MNSKLSCQELVSKILEKVSMKLPQNLADKALVAVGIKPQTEEAKAWLNIKTMPEEICIVSLMCQNRMVLDYQSREYEFAIKKMIQAEAEYYRTLHLARSGKIQRINISHESDADEEGCAVRFLIEEHDDRHIGKSSETEVMEIFVFVDAGDAHQSRKAAWSVEPMLIDWARQSGRVKCVSHKPQF